MAIAAIARQLACVKQNVALPIERLKFLKPQKSKMKNIVTILLILTIASCKKEVFNPALTRQFNIQSTSNGATYTIKVALPENYNISEKKYSAIYVLDGEEDFDYVANQCTQISNTYNQSNALVISIGYGNNRAVDYTPTRVNGGGGGAEKFMLFIKNELIPLVEERYGADTTIKSRVILGHSYGGLFAAYAFTNFNTVFGNYLILSPSLWYDNEVLFRMEQNSRGINNNSHQLVFMGIGGKESSGRMQAPFEGFYQRLVHNYPAIKIVKHIEYGLDHMGSKKPNISEALSFYFQNK